MSDIDSSPKLSERRVGQLALAFIAFGFLGLLVGGVSVGWVMALNERRVGWVNHTYDVERHINALRIDTEQMESARRGYLIDQDPSFQSVYAGARAAVPGELASLTQLTADNPRQGVRLAQLRQVSDQFEGLLARSIFATKAGRRALAQGGFMTDGSVQLARSTRRITADMLAEENNLLATRVADQKDAVRLFFIALASSGVLLAAVAAASIWLILRYTRDLTASRNSLRRLNDNLEQAVEVRTWDLQRANDEIQRFAYIVSHDLRSPLVNVLGFTSELDAASKPILGLIERAEAEAPQIVNDQVRRAVREDMPEAIGFIRSSTQKMDRLINAILRLSREGRRTITPEPLDMDQLVGGVADSLHHRVDELGAQIVIDRPLPPLTTDRVAIEQILSNLVENAVKYLKPGRPGRIRISGRTESGRAIFEVADNGRGIDPKDHERVFDLFRRSGVQDQPGEGIGLAHARALAYRLGGVVSCDSALDEGAVFTLSLPASYSGEDQK